METFDQNQLRELFRTLRKAKQLKQQDLEEAGISTTTVSNFELGKKKVSLDKVYRLFEKVGVNKQELPRLLTTKKQQETDTFTLLHLELKAIETEMDCGDYAKAKRAIIQLNLPTDHPYTAVTTYLRGKYHYKTQNWTRSYQYFAQAIQQVDQHSEVQATNVKAASFYDLGRIAYRQNQLDIALQYVNSGIEAFEMEGSREYLLYGLKMSKVIYLEKLDRDNEALKVLENMWKHLSEIHTEILLNMFDLQAKLFNKHQLYEKAIHYSEKGIEIARRENSYDRCFELWTTLGTSYNKLGKFSLAMKCFQTAASLEAKIQRKFLSAINHYQLGLLYLEEKSLNLAAEELEKAMKISKQENDLQKHCESQLSYARCKLKQNLSEEAIHQLEQALQLAEKHTFRTLIRDIALELTKYYEHQNKEKHYQYMTVFYQNSLLLNGGDAQMTTREFQPLTVERIFEGDPPDM